MTHRCIDRKDKISELPTNIIESILERIPIRDVARTSILSTKWKSTWTTISQLMLVNQFFEETLKIKPIVQHELVSIVEKILLLHNGPILTFILCIPKVKFDCSADIDRWIVFLSRNGIKDLTLNNSNNEPYKSHSSIYSCPELTRLKVVNCSFKAPQKLRGFRNLISLHLDKITFAQGMLMNLLLRSPMLQRLTIQHCTNIGNLSIYAPKLNLIRVHYNHGIKLMCVLDTRNLNYMSIILGTKMVSLGRGKTPDVLGDLPRIATLHLDGFFLKVLAAHGVPRRLPTTAHLLKSLALYNIGLNDLDHVSCTLCLIRSCPNLTTLRIIV